MSTSSTDSIQRRYLEVLGRVAEAADKYGRSPELVRVVVVTKMHPVEVVRRAIQAGVEDLGENYAEEALEKMHALGDLPRKRWHMIGHVQSRKAQLVASHFDLVHSLDSYKLGARLNHFAADNHRLLPVLLECNASGEPAKFGYPAWEDSQWPMLATETERLLSLPNLEVRGLMTMPPLSDDSEDSRSYFRRLRMLRDYLVGKIPEISLDQLSMGTSADFAVAVEEGATVVRVGTAILGPRGNP
jgi:pyridoxal phosphate enzyme (YggS family)